MVNRETSQDSFDGAFLPPSSSQTLFVSLSSSLEEQEHQPPIQRLDQMLRLGSWGSEGSSSVLASRSPRSVADYSIDHHPTGSTSTTFGGPSSVLSSRFQLKPREPAIHDRGSFPKTCFEPTERHEKDTNQQLPEEVYLPTF